MLTYFFWPLAVALMALGQGLLLPAIRRTPPGSEARRQALALHYVLVASYYLPLVLTPNPLALGVGAAVASRLLFFDLVLNAASGQALFYVGQTAASDKLLQRLALGLGWPAPRLRLAGWLLALGFAVTFIVTRKMSL